MKRFLLLSLLLVITLLTLYFIRVSHIKSYTISSTFDNTLSSIQNPSYWEKWHPLLRSLPAENPKTWQLIRDTPNHVFKFLNKTDSLVVEAVTPLLYHIYQYHEDKISAYAYELVPSLSNNSMVVKAIEKIPILFYLPTFRFVNEGDKGALALKAFLKNSKAFYGYDIQIKNVIDTVFVIITKTIRKHDLFRTLPIEFSKINQYIHDNNLTQKSEASVAYSPNGDSLALILGVPVNKFAASSGEIRCANIPKGRMLIADYKGIFSERQKIYDTFKKYVRDHYLENVGAPFETYVNDKLPASDSDLVQFTLHYPIR